MFPEYCVALQRVRPCSLDFGIGEFLAAALVSGGIGAETAGIAAPILVGGLEGAGLGAATSGLSGGNPLTGAITGGLSGGALAGLGGAGGFVDSAFGNSLGSIGSDALVGAGSGALGAGLTGGDPLQGAITGGAGGAVTGALGDLTSGGGGLSDIFGGGSTPSGSAFGGAPSDASGAATYAPSVAPGVEGGGALATSPLNLGTAGGTLASGPGAAAFTPPASATGSIDLTGNFGSPGGSVFTGASTADALPVTGAASAAGAVDPLTPEIIQNAGGVVGVDPGNLPTPPVPPAGGAPSSGFFHDVGGLISDAGKFVSGPTGKLIGTGISGLGLANSLLSAGNPNPIPGMAQLEQLATSLGATGSGLLGPNSAASADVANQAHQQAGVLENYLNTGTLPPAVQTSLDQATNTAITAIKAQYAARGMPPGSSSEIQDINAVKQNAVIQGGTLAATLYSQGVSQDQLASQIYNQLVGSGAQLASSGAGVTSSLVNDRTALNTGLNTSIANLAASLGGGRTITNNGTTQALAA